MDIEIRNLEKAYTGGTISGVVHAVKKASLKIPSNTIFGIIGKSGAGKSTLVRLISLLEKPDSGEILYNGERVDSLNGKDLIARRRRIGMIFQNFNLFSSRNAEQNVAYPLEIIGMPKKEIEKRTKELLELVGLGDRAKSPISKLSGGQKQRVAIARALANNPDILFCDEATSALDPQTTISILKLIKEIQKKMNLTVVMITHQMEVVKEACTHVAVVNDGEIVEQGLIEDIFFKPKHYVTKDFIKHLPSESLDKNEANVVQWSNCSGKYILRFIGKKTDEPILSRISKLFDLEFNICAGGTINFNGSKAGALYVDFLGEKTEIEKVLKYLADYGVDVEEYNESDY
ncbi:MAG: methionine ABC transporter ATP-binding protein [Treponema sp.]|nr:methionine ABC transporter ATP-binding protein [Treponema sp.]